MTVPGRNAPRHHGKVWGPGAPGKRLPAMRLSYSRDIPGRLVFLGAAFLFVLAYMQVMRATPGRTSSAFAGDVAAPGSAAGSGAKPANGRGAFQGLLDGAEDGVVLEGLDTSKPTDPYRTLMWNMKRYSVAEISSIAITVSAQDLINTPGDWRGQPVRATGQMIKAPELQRLGKNEAGYDFRWRGFMVDDDGGAIIFDMFDKPEKEFDRTDVVSIEGVFLQLVTYEARGGVKRVPFLIVKSVRPFTGERTGSLGASPATLLLVAALLLAAIPVLGYMVSSFLQRKHEAELVAALDKARSRRVANAAAKKVAGAPGMPAMTASPVTGSEPPAQAAPPTSAPAAGGPAGPIAPTAPDAPAPAAPAPPVVPPTI